MKTILLKSSETQGGEREERRPLKQPKEARDHSIELQTDTPPHGPPYSLPFFVYPPFTPVSLSVERKRESRVKKSGEKLTINAAVLAGGDQAHPCSHLVGGGLLSIIGGEQRSTASPLQTGTANQIQNGGRERESYYIY